MNSGPKCFSHVVERRAFGRRQTFLHAMIVAKCRPLIPCIVRDLSDGGARIEVEMPAWLPSRFQLVIEATNLNADCEVAYRLHDSVGVSFAVPIKT